MILIKIYLLKSAKQIISGEVLMKFDIPKPQDDVHYYDFLTKRVNLVIRWVRVHAFVTVGSMPAPLDGLTGTKCPFVPFCCCC
jgi:hypothetical protein